MNTTTELIERLRSFEKNYKPEEWRAIRMRDVTALLDTIEAQAKQIQDLNLRLISSFGETQNALERIEALQADAERYTWAVDNQGLDWDVIKEHLPKGYTHSEQGLHSIRVMTDEAIDAVRKGETT